MPQKYLRDLDRLRGSVGKAEKRPRKKQHPKPSVQPNKKPGDPGKETHSTNVSPLVEKPEIDFEAAVGVAESNVLAEQLDGMPSSPLTASPDYLEKHLDSIQPDPDYMRWLETRHHAMVKDSDCKGGLSLIRDDEAYEKALDCWFPVPGETSDVDFQPAVSETT